jgi:hypothetical protein
MTEVQTTSIPVDAEKVVTAVGIQVQAMDNVVAVAGTQEPEKTHETGEPRGIKRKRRTESSDEESDESDEKEQEDEASNEEELEEHVDEKEAKDNDHDDHEQDQDKEEKSGKLVHDEGEQDEQDEDEEKVKEPAKKKRRLSEQEEQEKTRARKAKQKLIAESGEIYHVKGEDLSSESKQKLDKGFSLEQKLVHRKSKLKKLNAKTRNVRAELTYVFAKVVGNKKYRTAIKAAIALGDALAANEDAQMEAKVRGKSKASSSDLVPKSELQKIKTDCIIAKRIASNGWEYTYRMKPGKLPPANKKFVREAAVRLICEKKFLSQQHQVPKQVEYFIDVLYSQSFRSKFRKEPESVIDCKLPKPPKEKKNKKAKEGEESQEDAIDQDASKDEEAESD